MKYIKNISWYIGILLLLFTLPYSFSHYNETIIRETLANKVLDIEIKHGLNVTQAHHELLDNITNEASVRVQTQHPELFNATTSEISTKRQITKPEAISIFTIIDKILTDMNFVHGQTHFLSDSLTGRHFDKDLKEAIHGYLERHSNAESISSEIRTFIDENNEKMSHISKHLDEKYYFANCEIMSILYKSIFQSLGINIYIVKAPKHSFVRWKTSDEYLNVEVTNFNFIADSEYIKHFKLSNNLISEGIFMRSLDADEDTAYLYVHLGNRNIDLAHKAYPNKQYADMLQHYNIAIKLYSEAINKNIKYPTALNNRGVAYLEKADILSQSNRPKALNLLKHANNDIGLALKQYPNIEYLDNQRKIEAYLRQLI